MDKVRYAVLGSGSSANAYIFEKGNFSFLIDNGFSVKEIEDRAKAFDFNLEKLKFIFLTHTHEDHFRGVGALSRKYEIPVVMNRRIPFSFSKKIEVHSRLDIKPDKEYAFDYLNFTPFSTSHDAAHSLGFHFSIGDLTFTLLTDTGVVPARVGAYVRISDVLFLEANYDDKMLAEGPYPPFLKKRISSSKGHLSNEDAVDFLNKLEEGEGPGIIYLCHLSNTNNSIDSLRRVLAEKYEKKGRKIVLCKKGEALRSFENE